MLKLKIVSLLSALVTAASGISCGLEMAPCHQDEICVPLDPTCTDLSHCVGTCRTPPGTVRAYYTATKDYKSCGGFTATPQHCPVDYKCIDDPRSGGCGMACDMPGICVPKDSPTCAGFSGRMCKKETGLQCYDYPGDSCNPKNGGADCIGICLYPLKDSS
jgi:hypothetical protein